MNFLKHKIRLFVAASLLVAGGATIADESDHLVVVKSARSVQQVVTEDLQLTRFAKQIATYNNIASVNTMLPVGSTLAVPKPYLDTAQHGRVAYVKGDVTHKQTDLVVNPPTKGAQVYQGDIIQTGPDGFISLTFKSGARVQVQPESRVVVNDINCISEQSECVISLTATDGQVSSEVTPRSGDQPPVQFSIETPFLTAAVRGTAFYVDLDDTVNRIGVTKGLVATQGGGQDNDLPKGKGMRVSDNSSPELVDLLPAPSLPTVAQRRLYSEEDGIVWQGLDGASAYRADLALDESMSQRVTSNLTENVSFNTPSLAPGDYYLSVAGIDAKDFLGLPVKEKVAIAEISDDEKPVLELSRQDGVTMLSVPGYDGQLELLISNSVNSVSASSRIVENTAESLSLELDETKDWVFRARKILAPFTVSSYSEYYVFSAREP